MAEKLQVIPLDKLIEKTREKILIGRIVDAGVTSRTVYLANVNAYLSKLQIMQKALEIAIEHYLHIADCDYCPLAGMDDDCEPVMPYGIECGAGKCHGQLVKYWIRKAADDAKRDS